ncbi:MAG: hypothetical protein C4325_12750 [Blastocatellia bacterium]
MNERENIRRSKNMKNCWTALFLIVFLGIGCKLPSSLSDKTFIGNGKSANQTVNSSSQDRPNESVAANDPREELFAVARKFRDLPYFTATMTGDGVGQFIGRLEYVAPDKYRFVSGSGPTAGIEFVIIGKQTFIKSGGKWNRTPVDIRSKIPSVRELLEEQEIRSLRSITREADEVRDGTAAAIYVYQGASPAKSISYRSRLWVDKATGLPLKVVVEYDSGDRKSMTIKYDTVTPITIEPPLQ